MISCGVGDFDKNIKILKLTFFIIQYINKYIFFKFVALLVTFKRVCSFICLIQLIKRSKFKNT